MEKHQGFLNVYRSGYFHTAGKPGAFDRHAGDIYPTAEAAALAIDPMSHYVATVPVEWEEPVRVEPNPPAVIFDEAPAIVRMTDIVPAFGLDQ